MIYSYNFAVIIFVAIFGLVIGSFLNVLIYRVPYGESVVRPRSKCRRCGHRLAWFENIPVFSIIFLKFKCRHCGAPISPVYPIVELLTCVVFVVSFIYFSISLAFFKTIVLAAILIVCSFSDAITALDKENFETGVVPSIFPIIGIVLGFMFAVLNHDIINALAGAAAGYLILYVPAFLYSLIRKREGMGEGDFSIFAMIGMFEGVDAVPVILTLSACLGLVVGIIIILVTRNRNYGIPFVPMLGAASLIYIFCI